MFLTTDFKLSNLGRDLPIKIGNNHIKRVQTTKYLGIHLDENLKWNEHVNKLCSKVNRSISGLKLARDYVPLYVLNTIYKSLIQPVFVYCDVVWDNLDQGLATKLQKLQNRAARIITFQGYDVRSAQIQKQLNWEELASRRQIHLSLLMHDSVNRNVPSYLSDVFSNARENNPYKSKLRNSEYNVVLDHVPKTEYCKGSFSCRGGILWNSLPTDIKTSESKAIVKRKLANRQANY